MTPRARRRRAALFLLCLIVALVLGAWQLGGPLGEPWRTLGRLAALDVVVEWGLALVRSRWSLT